WKSFERASKSFERTFLYSLEFWPRSQSHSNELGSNFFVITGILALESISFEQAWMSFERDVKFLGLETNYRKVVRTSF
ncbi:hypothetical protein GIB67_010447, partial [Kingdonia uniflora]